MKIITISQVLITICFVWTTIGMVACKDDEHTDAGIKEPEDELVELPVEDQMRFTADMPITVLGSYSGY